MFNYYVIKCGNTELKKLGVFNTEREANIVLNEHLQSVSIKSWYMYCVTQKRLSNTQIVKALTKMTRFPVISEAHALVALECDGMNADFLPTDKDTHTVLSIDSITYILSLVEGGYKLTMHKEWGKQLRLKLVA